MILSYITIYTDIHDICILYIYVCIFMHDKNYLEFRDVTIGLAGHSSHTDSPKIKVVINPYVVRGLVHRCAITCMCVT